MSNNKPWKSESTHKEFSEADKKRKKLLNIWSSAPVHAGMQVKVKRYSDGRFVVKTRLHPDFDQKQGNKSGKNKRRNKKDSSKRKPDTSSAI